MTKIEVLKELKRFQSYYEKEGNEIVIDDYEMGYSAAKRAAARNLQSIIKNIECDIEQYEKGLREQYGS